MTTTLPGGVCKQGVDNAPDGNKNCPDGPGFYTPDEHSDHDDDKKDVDDDEFYHVNSRSNGSIQLRNYHLEFTNLKLVNALLIFLSAMWSFSANIPIIENPIDPLTEYPIRADTFSPL